MAKGLQIDATTNVMRALSINFRTTSTFFREKDAVLADYSPKMFPHFARDDRHFSLIDMKERTVVRFETNRAVARSEGHGNLDEFNKAVRALLDILKLFQIQDVGRILLHDIRCVPTKNFKEAREYFCGQFCTTRGESILDVDMSGDYSLTVQRKWFLDSKMQEQKAKNKCEIEARGVVLVGPVTGDEIAERWIEFHDKADNNLYKVPNPSPPAGVLANMEMHALPYEQDGQKSTTIETLNAFYEWAGQQTDTVWQRVITS